MNISMIAALAKNRVIGFQNQLPWRLRTDLQHFLKCTMGKPIVMGRKTYDSIGKPLPGRENIILSSQQNLVIADCKIIHKISELKQFDAAEIMIIGGATLYEMMLPYASTLYLTFVDCEPEGDTFFPAWKSDDWQTIAESSHLADEQNDHDFQFVQLQRKQPAIDWEGLCHSLS